MRKAKDVEKEVRVIREYQDGHKSRKEAAGEIGISGSEFRCMVRRYEKDGVAALMPRSPKIYSDELKRDAAEAYINGKGSLEKICDEYGIRAVHQLRDWIKVYNAHGDFSRITHSGGGSYMKQGRDTTKEERIEIVKDCLASGKNYGEMALKYKVSYQQVRTWTLRFEEMGETGLEDRRGKRKKDQTPRTELEAAQIEIERLKHQLYMAEMERDLQKNWTRSRGGMPLTSEAVSPIPSCTGMPCREELPC